MRCHSAARERRSRRRSATPSATSKCHRSGGRITNQVDLARWSVVLLLAAAERRRRLRRPSPLIEAVKRADRDRNGVAALLRQGVDPNGADSYGSTALHWAVDLDDLATVELLIRAGANPKATNRYGVAPLSLACTNGNAAIIGRLLDAGADPNTMAPGGETALMTASRTGKVDAVEILLARGADVNARESVRGQTALMWAAAEGHASAIRALVAAGADVNARSHRPTPASAGAGAATAEFPNLPEPGGLRQPRVRHPPRPHGRCRTISSGAMAVRSTPPW